jgi:glycosyltransferase involved in cell wall biosynthesis
VRICLASIHPRMLSGQIESLVALRDGLESLGHEVRVVSAFDPDHLRMERRWAQQTTDALALAPKVVRIGSIIAQIAQVARQSELVHFNVPTPAFGALADWLQLSTGRPLVVGFEAHLAQVPDILPRLTAAPEFYLPRLLVNNGLVARATLRRGRRYVVSSEFQRDELCSLGYGSGHVEVIPNLIDEAKLRRWDRQEARAALGLPDGPIVGFVGHYHDVKGHDVLIDAFRMVANRVPDARLALAWSGIGSRSKTRAAMERAGIADRVVELGRVDVGQFFSAIDVAALPYRFSIGQATVLEAMWVGVPLVTTRLPLLEELCRGEAALLASPGDASDLAVQITRKLTEKELASGAIAAQRVLMSQRFDRGNVIEQYVRLYERALAKVGAAAPTTS